MRMFDQVISRPSPPRVTAVLSRMFHGVEESLSKDPVASPETEGSVCLMCNTYLRNRVRAPGTHFIVEAELGTALAMVADVRLRPVRVERAFEYPYAAGDTSYEDNPTYLRLTEQLKDDVDVGKLVTRWALLLPECHRPHLLEVSMHNSDKGARDLEVERLGDEEQGLTSRWCRFSRSEIARRGLVWANGICCSEPVYRLLREDLNTPFFGVVEF